VTLPGFGTYANTAHVVYKVGLNAFGIDSERRAPFDKDTDGDGIVDSGRRLPEQLQPRARPPERHPELRHVRHRLQRRQQDAVAQDRNLPSARAERIQRLRQSVRQRMRTRRPGSAEML
jgi:hypothetical protein